MIFTLLWPVVPFLLQVIVVGFMAVSIVYPYNGRQGAPRPPGGAMGWCVMSARGRYVVTLTLHGLSAMIL
jgi:hypothetical protein